MVFLVVVKFFVFVSEVVSIFSKILTWIIGGQKDTFAPSQLNYWGRAPQLPPKSTPMVAASDVNCMMKYADKLQMIFIFWWALTTFEQWQMSSPT